MLSRKYGAQISNPKQYANLVWLPGLSLPGVGGSDIICAVRRYLMPIYSYRCDECGIQFDRRQSFDDRPLKRCPECNKLSLRKLYQPVGIVFKGSGFYSTDHRSSSNVAVSSSSESSSTEGKADRKSASKIETPASESSSKKSEE
jgi:putative FmdB family regulatory protein